MLFLFANDKKKWLLLPVFCILCACARNPYKTTNKIYRQEAKVFAKQLSSFPVADSLQPPAYAAGTINFNLRKPNFVVIHHTAQIVANKL